MRDSGLCPDCIRQNLAAIPSGASRAKSAVRFLAVAGVVGGLNVLTSVWTLQAPEADEVRDWIETLTAFVGLIAVVGTPISYLMWLHRAVRQVNGMGKDVGATPGWAVGYWFVPFIRTGSMPPAMSLERGLSACLPVDTCRGHGQQNDACPLIQMVG